MKKENDNALLNALEVQETQEIEHTNIDDFNSLLQDVGAIKAFDLNAKLNELLKLRKLFKIKNGKLYKQIGLNWGEFLSKYNLQRRLIDMKLKDMREIGEEAYCALVGLGFRDTDLRMLKSEERVAIEEPKAEGEPPVVTVDGQAVVVTEENTEMVKELIARLATERNQEREKTIKSKEEIKEKKREIGELKERVQGLENPTPQNLSDLQLEIGGMQNTLISLYTRFQGLAKRYQDKPNHIAAIDSGIAWVVRFSESFAALTDPGIDEPDEDFYNTSFLHPENLTKEEE